VGAQAVKILSAVTSHRATRGCSNRLATGRVMLSVRSAQCVHLGSNRAEGAVACWIRSAASALSAQQAHSCLQAVPAARTLFVPPALTVHQSSRCPQSALPIQTLSAVCAQDVRVVSSGRVAARAFKILSAHSVRLAPRITLWHLDVQLKETLNASNAQPAKKVNKSQEVVLIVKTPYATVVLSVRMDSSVLDVLVM